MKFATHLLIALVIIANVGRAAAAAVVTTGSIDLGSDHDHENEHEHAVLRLGSREEALVSDSE